MSTPTAPGWYEDPEDPDQLRYFDGIVWSSHTTPRRPAAPVRPEPTGAVPTGWGQAPGSHGQPGYGPSGHGAPQNPWAAPPPPAGGQVTWGTTRSDVLPDGARLAEWWRRLVAKIIDWVVVGLIGALLSAGYLTDLVGAFQDYIDAAVRAAESGATPDTSALEAATLDAALPITLISLAVTIVYDVLFLVWRGATPGKMVLGTIVRPADAPGRVSLGVALRRQAILVVTNLVGLVPVVGILGTMLSVLDPAWLLWDPRRQALHDKVADTVVVIRAS
jgi:uncharacterized RDD family membrane protein YckC